MRATLEFNTPLNRKLILNEYMTEAENRQVMEIAMNAIDTIETGASETGSVQRITDKAFKQKMNDKVIELMVVSYADITDRAELLRVLRNDVPRKEYAYVVDTINGITEEKKDS